MPGIWSFHPDHRRGPGEQRQLRRRKRITTEGRGPCNVEADSAGHAYANLVVERNVKQYRTSRIHGLGPDRPRRDRILRHLDARSSPTRGTPTSMSTRAARSPSTTTNRLAESQKFGERLDGASSRGVAINAANGHVYATSGNNIVEFGLDAAAVPAGRVACGPAWRPTSRLPQLG